MGNETKHTPGPWSSARVSRSEWTITDARGVLVAMVGDSHPLAASVPGMGPDFAEMENNAHLVKAAPKMYEALRAIQDHIKTPVLRRGAEWHAEGSRIEALANAALAEAEGKAP